jgi:penicillin-binding protein 1A
MEAPEPAFSYEGLVTAVRGNSARVQVGPFTGDVVFPPNLNGKTPKLQVHDLIRVRVADQDGPLRFEYDPSPTIEGALIAMDQHTGYVKAMVGGYDFERSHFNRVTQAKRQPGSSFKPLVYAAALDHNFTPASVIVDEPISFNDNGRIWAPQNYEKKFFGPTSLREALTHSRNVVTVKLADRMGIKYLIDYLPRFGIPGPLPRNLSIALGTTEVTPLELADAYCTFANNGMRPAPIFVTEITDQQGQVLEHSEPALAPAIPPPTAFQITSILEDVVKRGTGTRADGLSQPTAGKTGTTNDFGDTWFVGYTPQLLAVVWIGFDNKRPIGNKETGGKVAAPIWKAFMEQALDGVPPGEFPIPEGLKCVNVDPTSGGRAGAGSSSRLECFRPGTEPQPGAVPAVQLVNQHQPEEPSAMDFIRSEF